MWRHALSFFVVVLGMFCAFPAQAQRDLDQMFQRIRAFSFAGQHELALAEAQRFEAAVRDRYGNQHKAYGGALNALGAAHQHLGHYSMAEDIYRRVLEMPDGAQWGALNNLAVILEKQGRYSQAEAIYKQDLATKERTPNKKDFAGHHHAYHLPQKFGSPLQIRGALR